MTIGLPDRQEAIIKAALNAGYKPDKFYMTTSNGIPVHIDTDGNIKNVEVEAEGDKVRKLRAENSRLAADLSKEKGKIDRAAASVKQAEKVVAQLMHEVPSVHRELLEKLLVNFDAAQQDE